MFQKLYKHLEEIGSNIRQQRVALQNTEESNDKFLQWTEKCSEQLATLSQKKDSVSPMLQVAGVVVSCMAVSAIILFTWFAIHIAGSVRTALDRSAESSRTATESARAANLSYTGYHALNERTMNAEAEIVRLDSLVLEQSRAIKELKKLNEVSVHTFHEIKKALDRAEN